MSDTLQCLKPYIPSPHHWHRFANFATGFVIQYDITTRDTTKPCRVSHRLALKNRIPFNTFSSNVKNIAIRHFQRHQNFFSGNKDEKKQQVKCTTYKLPQNSYSIMFLQKMIET